MHQLDISRSSWRKLAAVACLGAFLLGGAGVLPGLAVLVARLDARHEVSVTVAEGEAQVVLHHVAGREGGPAQTVSHRHGVACALLCAGWADSARTPDHVLGFRTGGASELLEGKELRPGSPVAAAVHAAWLKFDAMDWSSDSDHAVESALNSPVSGRVPLMSSAVELLRSVNLLL